MSGCGMWGECGAQSEKEVKVKLNLRKFPHPLTLSHLEGGEGQEETAEDRGHEANDGCVPEDATEYISVSTNDVGMGVRMRTWATLINITPLTPLCSGHPLTRA